LLSNITNHEIKSLAKTDKVFYVQALAYYTRPLATLPGLNLVAAPPSPLHLALAVTIVAGGLLTLIAWVVFLVCGRRRPKEKLHAHRL
jgi:hypothetical protein